ncbi:4a-hydroxytetrahydrobiopterin dehydratase [Acidovorax sp. HDW3]|uniref:4a-hydroxytetrahydrobiopterin dehydratase n=1 Tax=Acidovorax sp. HDW3 TaxID=2714923 RepID=UPI00140CDB06|nr:4a-hydroxytetrahydrobiopterin dehydratase [Acidovorax sp. HDW3]QIL44593.1 4a-hydroxytetrahydrobiopterin dehydratase [Acidovorax sp. HDW3]
MLPKKDWSSQSRSALIAIEIRAILAQLPGWKLRDGALEKNYPFANYHETMAFVNAVAFIAHTQDHHPDLSVHYNHCIVRLSTHDVGGISATDIDCAARIDALLAAP